ncbi:MAG: Gfo/Idh/MocA family protein [Candidatus Brocadiia bacterium]
MFKGILAGLGSRGRHWLGQAREHADCELVAYVEPDAENAGEAVEQQDVPEAQIFENLEDAVAETDADFVLDVTPPGIHRQIAEISFEAGLHLLGEKPLSDNAESAKEMVEMGNEAGLRHMITQNYRFTPQPRTTRNLIADGLIGQPGQLDIRFYMSWADAPGSHYVTEPYMLINDMMVHHFDMMRYVLAEDPLRVHAITWNHPWGWHEGDAAHAIVFQFPEGLWATHITVGCAVGERTDWNGDWRIEGPGGSISWEDGGIHYAHLHRVEEPVSKYIELMDVPPGGKAILDEFFASIEEEREPECSAADNIKSLAMTLAAIQSAKEDGWVEMDEIL